MMGRDAERGMRRRRAMDMMATGAQVWAWQTFGSYIGLCVYLTATGTAFERALVDSIGLAVIAALSGFVAGALIGLFQWARASRMAETTFTVPAEVHAATERLREKLLERRREAELRLQMLTGPYGARYAAEFFFGLHLDGEEVCLQAIDTLVDEVRAELEEELEVMLTSEESGILRDRFEQGYIQVKALGLPDAIAHRARRAGGPP